jgi:hypothetical protein
MKTWGRFALVALLLATAGGARAADARPWAAGVSDSAQRQALALFRQGNDAFARSEYSRAAGLYRQALQLWDHPAIHGNLAQALIQLDDPVAALAELELALAAGAAPFDGEVYAHLQLSHKLLLGQLARIDVECEVDAAEVTLDGKPVLSGRGHATAMVVAGTHEIVARKAKHLTFASRVTALPAQPVVVRVNLVPLDRAGTWERRMKPWKPWVVLGAGAVVTAIGAGLELMAAQNLHSYETEIARECPMGCLPGDLPGPVRDLRDRGERQSHWAVGAFVVGGLTLTTGVLLLYLNQPERVEVDENGRRLGLAPWIGPGLAGAALTLRY